jgi:Tfp pilus assembly protein PilX
VLPAVLAALVALTLLGLAAFQSARLDSLAARSFVASIRAFYAAEAGLVLLESGRPDGADSIAIPGTRIEMARERVLTLPDGVRLVRLVSEAQVSGRAVGIEGRRRVSRLELVPPVGAGHRVAGSWRETIRP